MLSSLIIFLLGIIAIIIGVAMWSVPLAWIVGGSLCVLIAAARMIAVARGIGS